jgi:hypothetical protein
MNPKKLTMALAMTAAVAAAGMSMTTPASAAQAPAGTRVAHGVAGTLPSPIRIGNAPSSVAGPMISHTPCVFAATFDVWISYGGGTIFQCEAFWGAGFDNMVIDGAGAISTGAWTVTLTFVQNGGLWQYKNLPPDKNYSLPNIHIVGTQLS